MELKVKLTDGAALPRHAKEGDAGLDLTSRQTVEIAPQGTVMVGTGVACEIPEGHVGLVFPRSGLASRRGVNLANNVGVVDSGYRGEIKLPLYNAGHDVAVVECGERCAQLVIVPFATCECVEVSELSETERGEGGFGSSGRLYSEAVGVLESFGLDGEEADGLRKMGREAFGE